MFRLLVVVVGVVEMLKSPKSPEVERKKYLGLFVDNLSFNLIKKNGFG